VKPTIVIAGGGTGGHVFPGLAVASALEKLADVEVVFVGSPRGLEKELVPARGYRLELLDVAPMKGGGLGRAVRGALVAARATWRARGLARSLAPAAVLSVGGYAAGPMALASALAGVPLAILEPNGVLGLANRILAPLAKRAYVAWPDVGERIRARIVHPVGVPLRDGFEASPYRAGDSARVLVMGGSQGARAINDAMPEALAAIAPRVPRLEVVHQAGRGNDDALRAKYDALGLRADVRPFLDDVAGELRRADVVVARSGAGTVAEIAAVGRAAVFVPFPFAADDHQRSNAEALARRGGAVCVVQRDATPARLAEEIGALLADGDKREAMAEAARRMGRPRAAWDVADDLLHLARIPLRPARSKSNGNVVGAS
jgi:UDP-N-acetylglucosamine--N-acetylmuramyl-(pentapeptide) pyrophosphoryl-undecaprenol N-acetylglucosamine transferase